MITPPRCGSRCSQHWTQRPPGSVARPALSGHNSGWCCCWCHTNGTSSPMGHPERLTYLATLLLMLPLPLSWLLLCYHQWCPTFHWYLPISTATSESELLNHDSTWPTTCSDSFSPGSQPSSPALISSQSCLAYLRVLHLCPISLASTNLYPVTLLLSEPQSCFTTSLNKTQNTQFIWTLLSIHPDVHNSSRHPLSHPGLLAWIKHEPHGNFATPVS